MTGLTFYLVGSGDLKNVYGQYYANDGRLQMSVSLKVDKERFPGKLPKEQAAHLRRLQVAVTTYESDIRLSGRLTARADVERLLLESLGRKIKPLNSGTLTGYFGKYLNEIKAGNILNEGKEYSLSYKNTASAILKLLPKTKLGGIPVEMVTDHELRLFASELTVLKGRGDKPFAKNTVSVYFEFVRTFISEGRKMGWHKGPEIDAEQSRIGRETGDHAVYLTAEEMKTIYELDYSGTKETARDAFILGCLLGLRHVDLSKLSPVHRSGDLVNINTTKTGTPVWVPLGSLAREIWDKYGGQLQVPERCYFTDLIKSFGQDAGLTKKILFSRTEGGKKVERWVDKWELMGTHTCRRSFATNAYKAGVPVPSIMRVTGHKETSSFLKYIRLNDQEHAEMLLTHDHFK